MLIFVGWLPPYLYPSRCLPQSRHEDLSQPHNVHEGCTHHRGCASSDGFIGRNLSIGMSRHGPLAHPRSMKISYHSPAAARATSRCLGTSASVMSLTWELSAPRIVAFEHAEQSRA